MRDEIRALQAPPEPGVTGFFDVKAFGALGDGVADDTAAIVATIQAAQAGDLTPVAGITGSAVYFPPGEYRITSTITLQQFSGLLTGSGRGNARTYTASPGNATVIKWDGPANQPMLLLRDYAMVTIQNMRFEGHETNPPSYAIESRSISGDGAGTGAGLVVRDVTIGKWTWTSAGLNKNPVVNGIGFTGDNVNNDEFRLEGVQIAAQEIGLNVPNTQSIWGSLFGCGFGGCDTAGIVAGAAFTATDIHFDDCAVDIKMTQESAVAHVFGWWSERSRCIYDLVQSAGLNVVGGKWLIGSEMAGLPYLNAQKLIGANVSISRVDVAYATSPKPKLYLRGGYAPAPYLVSVQGCAGLDSSTLDTYGYGAPRVTWLDLATGDVLLQTTVTEFALSHYLEPRLVTTTAALIDGQVAPVICNGSSATVTLPAATGVRKGRTRFTVKNVNAAAATVASAGGAIDGSASVSLAQWESRTFISDGTNWLTI